VASLTSSVVEQTVAAHAQRDVFGHGKQLARAKREVIKKTLDDPNKCLDACRGNETSQLTKAILANTARLVAAALENIDLDDARTKEGQARMKQKVEASTINAMGPLFEDLCKIHKTTGLCYSKCPDSQGRTVLQLDNQGDQDTLCEPSRNWGNFSEYFTALNCTNTTETSKSCDGKCGRQQSIRNASHLAINGQSTNDDEEFNFDDDKDDDDDDLPKALTKSREKDSETDGIVLNYETDAKKNDKAAGAACKSIACHIDCYKPVISSKCGTKAYDLYNRMTKIEPHYSLAMLRVMKAVDHPDECKTFDY
jgi:hypothetical protein